MLRIRLVAGAGFEPASQVYETCGLPLSHPASKLVHVGGIEPQVFTALGHSFTGCCRRRWATHAWRRWRELNPRCRLSTDTPVFGTGDFTQLVHISKLAESEGFDPPRPCYGRPSLSKRVQYQALPTLHMTLVREAGLEPASGWVWAIQVFQFPSLTHGGDGEIRTLTPKHWFLRPACIPFHHIPTY